MARRNDFGNALLAGQHILDQLADGGSTADLVLVVLELAVDHDRIKRAAIGSREDVGIGNIRAGRRAGSGDNRQQARMVGRQNRDLGNRMERARAHHGRERLAGLVGIADKAGMADLVFQRHAEQIGLVVELGIGLPVLLAPAFQRFGEPAARRSRAFLARDFREAAGQLQLGLIIERAQELALPAVPDARANGADIGYSEDQQQTQALQRLDTLGKVHDRLAIVEVSGLRDHGHGQVFLDQPGHELRLLG